MRKTYWHNLREHPESTAFAASGQALQPVAGFDDRRRAASHNGNLSGGHCPGVEESSTTKLQV